jgi:BASS family bile acid:Na+ symporter
MTLVQLIPLVLQISIALIVISVALRVAPGDLTWLLRRPSLLLRSLLAMNIVMPFLGALVARLCHIRPSVEAALILLAVSPVPPILPNKQGKAGGDVSYAVGLLAVSAVVSILTVPFSVALIGGWFGLDLRVPPAAIAIVVGKSVLAPLVLGLMVKMLAPALAARLAKPLTIVGMLVLVLALLPVLVKMWPALAAQATLSSLVAIILFTLLSLAVGHLLGGPAAQDRTVLGLSTACRHPGVAVTIITAAAEREQKAVVVAAVFLCVLVGAIVTGPYAKWRGRAPAAAAQATS